MQPNDSETDQAAWKRFFDGNTKSSSSSSFQTIAKHLPPLLRRGAESACTFDESMQQYTFDTPLGGHGKVFVDILYMDDSLRIVRGHLGSIFVLSKLRDVPNDDDV